MYKAIGQSVIVEFDQVKEASKEGIIVIPSSVNQMQIPKTGVITSVGEECYASLIEGLSVMFRERVGEYLYDKNGEKKYILLHMSDIVCALVDSDE